VGQVDNDEVPMSEGCVMLLEKAQKYLDVVRKRGEAGKNLEKVYRMICCEELYLLAYQKLYANMGALTPGVDPKDTIDGMSLDTIHAIIHELKNRQYVWKPARRIYILKQDGRSKRPLGVPGWKDKMVQEVIRMVLEAYYEPQFSSRSHGFRPNKGCHTALREVKCEWTGVQWFIEGDIKGCFDNLDHTVILDILRRKIDDKNFLKLLKGMLEAGYMEDWKYHKTYSGTPQGGIVSPLLANIVLHELDSHVEKALIPRFTRGKTRKRDSTYMQMANQAVKARKAGNYREAKRLHKIYSTHPTQRYNDPEFRRLKYVRYADDFLLGFIGTKAEAKAIKAEIGEFLRKEVNLEMSKDKTLVTHASDGTARFLNYEIRARRSQEKSRTERCGRWTTRRNYVGQIELKVPMDVVKQWKRKVSKKGIIHRVELVNNSDFDIISLYESQTQGVINYYCLAQNVVREMWKLRSCYQESLIKTLAAKHKEDAAKIIKKYLRYMVDGRKVIAVEVKREGKKPLKAVFGAQPIRKKKTAKIQDEIQIFSTERTQLIERLLADVCELCGKSEKLEGHHIKKLKDLKKKQRKLEHWEKRMIAIRRKTLFVCGECHKAIHNGTYDGRKLA
jgi:group II intron reverse transcriptase/maturase